MTMAGPEALRQVVAEVFGADPGAIDAAFPLRHPQMQGSAGRAILAAAIRRKLGVYNARAITATHYGELEAAIFGTPAPAAGATAGATARAAALVTPPEPAEPEPSATDGAGPALPGVRVGVDVEMVESMPDAPDFWTAPFYQAHFTPAEIAYCVRQEQPRMHFAARWCAKEALAKCEPRFAGVDPTTVQVRTLAGGQPVLEVVEGGGARRIDVAVSLSHTPLMAIAVVAAAVRTEA